MTDENAIAGASMGKDITRCMSRRIVSLPEGMDGSTLPKEGLVLLEAGVSVL